MFVRLFSIITLTIYNVEGHGRLIDPPGRSSLWRFGFSNAEPNYNDNELNCGGFDNQQANGGKCGLCGDPVQGPLENQAGGKYANGIIARTYNSSSDINVSVDITANHKGYFEFRLCENNNFMKNITQECLDKHILKEKSTGNKTIFLNSDDNKIFHYTLSLPPGVICSQCVLQWKYNAGNSWGTSEDGTQCIGCGQQEQFYGCSDIEIVASNTTSGSTVHPSTILTTILKSSTITTQSLTIPQGSTTAAPKSTLTPDSSVTTTQITTRAAGNSTNTCHGVEPYYDSWCNTNCNNNPPFCPASHCKCTLTASPALSVPTTPATTTSQATTTERATTTTQAAAVGSSTKMCHAVGSFNDDSWCNTNCNHNPPYCPDSYCKCT